MSILNIQDLKVSYPSPLASDGGGVSFELSVKSLNLAAGERVALVGGSGTGKSTLLNAIAGLQPFSSGEIEVMQTGLSGQSAIQLDRIRGAHMGLLFQSLNLLPFVDAVANVAVAGTFSGEKRQRAKEGQTPRELLLSLGLDETHLSKPVRLLSLGQQQRVAVARAIYGRPDLILADEPTSSLDHRNRDRFIEVLFKAFDTTRQALLLATHDQELAAKFDRVLDIADLGGGPS